MKLAAVVLAGGQSRRMGGTEKSLMKLCGGSPLELILQTLDPQVEAVAINANGDPERFSFAGLPVIADSVPDFVGPLAGVLAGMRWAAEQNMTHVLTAAADTPFLPSDVASRLSAALSSDTSIAMASSADRIHPVCGVWPVSLADDLEHFLVDEDKRKILEFAKRYDLLDVKFSTKHGDPFFNINTPKDFAKAKRLAEEQKLG
ncbi:MAG: molybdenum cofactor guanylyltransferase MobA [Rhizobiaceae bacterium]